MFGDRLVVDLVDESSAPGRRSPSAGVARTASPPRARPRAVVLATGSDGVVGRSGSGGRSDMARDRSNVRLPALTGRWDRVGYEPRSSCAVVVPAVVAGGARGRGRRAAGQGGVDLLGQALDQAA